MTQVVEHNYSGHGTQGENYQRDLPLKEVAGRIRTQLKREFPSCKFSVRCEFYSMGQALHVSLVSAPFEAFDASHDRQHRGYAQLSQYAFANAARAEQRNSNGAHLTQECWNVMSRAAGLASSYNYDDSDSMSDYFSTNFYLHLNIGGWDKPFVKTGSA